MADDLDLLQLRGRLVGEQGALGRLHRLGDQHRSIVLKQVREHPPVRVEGALAVRVGAAAGVRFDLPQGGVEACQGLPEFIFVHAGIVGRAVASAETAGRISLEVFPA